MKPSSVLLVFLQLCCFQTMLVSRPTCKLPGGLVKNTSTLLLELGDPFPVQCRQYNNKIFFPDSALSDVAANHRQCRWTSLVVYEFLRGAELMFIELPKGEGGLTWNEQKLDHYRNLQNRLVEEHQCLNTTEASAVLAPYFSKVTAVVGQQDSATCGWEALRRDVHWVLMYILHKHHNCLNWTKAR